MVAVAWDGSHFPDEGILVSKPRALQFVGDIDIPAKPRLLKHIDSLNEIKSIAGLIRCDPAMSAAVLKVVNSAWVGLPNNVNRIEQAVVLLGAYSVKNIIRAISFRTAVENIAEPVLIKHFWRSSWKTAKYASTIAKYLHLCNIDDAYTLGLFHHAGYPVLSNQRRNVYKLLVKCYEESAPNFLSKEIAVYHIDHAAVGAKLARAWGLSEQIAQGIAAHHTLRPADFASFDPINNLVVTLKLAELLSEESKELAGVEQNNEWRSIRSVCMDYASLTESDLLELAKVCKNECRQGN